MHCFILNESYYKIDLRDQIEDPLVVESQRLLVPQFQNEPLPMSNDIDIFENAHQLGYKQYISQYPRLDRPTE